jgi:NAD(P)-dependent dehydrogenase (short-subunit alcohol dehydrogenase family)
LGRNLERGRHRRAPAKIRERRLIMRLENKIAIVVGGGQSPGETMGNGRATAVLFAREGAKVLVGDNRPESAEETADMIRAEGGTAEAVAVDITDEASIQTMVKHCLDLWGRIDVLHNNVGVSIAGGDAEITEITSEAFDRVVSINLKGMVLTCKHVIPVMREQKSGSIVSISSIAAWNAYPLIGYKTTKQAVIAMTEQIAFQNAPYGVRANVILPGLMDTPMAVDTRVRALGKSREEIEAGRNARVPLRNRMGTGWDVAKAALFLASDDAEFITGAALPVDGGEQLNVG